MIPPFLAVGPHLLFYGEKNIYMYIYIYYIYTYIIYIYNIYIYDIYDIYIIYIYILFTVEQ